MIPSNRSSSTSLGPTARDSDAVRPRNRRLANARNDPESSVVSSPGQSPTRSATPIPAAHVGTVTGRNHSGLEVARGSAARGKSPAAGGTSLLGASWAPSWASVTDFASSLIAGGESERPGSRSGSKTRDPRRQVSHQDIRKNQTNWGPSPPSESRLRLQDVAAGSLTEREAALRTMRTASVLESHEGVNGGLNFTRNFKKRSSDEDLRASSQHNQEQGEHLVYIHHVQSTDTYAGIVLKYRCREDAFRKANGLWSRDNIQIRKWLALPVDACEVKGRPCDGPTSTSTQVDLLAKTPEAEPNPFGRRDNNPKGDDYFAGSANGHSPDQSRTGADDDRPWTHVRWVSIDSYPRPVEIGRVERKALGYFPPRRKKSMHTTSTVSTPRGSVDVPSFAGLGSETGGLESPGSTSSRRPSLLTGRPPISTIALGSSPSNSSLSRVNSGGGEDIKPAWMRRPGGVGSMGRNVRVPGPEKDYFNSWTNKHIPGLNIDKLPSMSIMGSETARFGFGRAAGENPAIVESPFENGRDTTSTSRNQAGTGLDKAAAAIETWLRGAFAKRPPGTPILGPRGRSASHEAGDLIELEDTNSDDGRGYNPFSDPGGLLSSITPGASSSRSTGAETVRGRTMGSAATKSNKAD
ncbi:hypothetical protein B0H63DRAFT_125610 [Podospora didyma]|uniref:LysM domain-containing protein n=1 Tax=Podospora didyma TaxID=330526 RepID=A0AAE0P097_9PEZI|nr:hypothetical protein B0H63DRAFT_125610 [Podospora didyma]